MDLLFLVATAVVCLLISSSRFSETLGQLIRNETLAIAFLESLEKEGSAICHNTTMAEWIYASDMTPTHRTDATKATTEYFKFWKRKWNESQQYKWDEFRDPLIRRQFKIMSTLGTSALSEEMLKKYNALKQKLESIYSVARICKPSDLSKCDLALDPEITDLMMYSRNETELRSVWLQWRDVTGRKMRKDYEELSDIMSEIAKANKFSTVSEYETKSYEIPQFVPELDKLWGQLEPFYLELHAYVRWKLGQKYGTEIVNPAEPIPSHLLGNMWAQSWTNIWDIVMPYQKAQSIDATPSLIAQKFTPRKMAKIAEEFFVSMGFPQLPPEFWSGSIFEKSTDKEMVCHASSWDLCDGKNFWIKQCTRITMEDFITLHHEMGHTMYQIQYKTKPKLFRAGANAAFHEAIGDLIALSVQTPQHLHKIGLLEEIEQNPETDINHLMLMALEKIAFLPFGLLVDKWRWSVFEGNISSDKYNCEWWMMRNIYQGLRPPEKRSQQDFDPGAKYHVAANAGYIRYFISTIVEFQFHQALCTTAGQFDSADSTKPLHKCDIFGSMEAGEKLMKMLQMGSSAPWPDAMEVLTGQRNMDAGPILHYFQPLIDWLKIENRRNNVTVGWNKDDQFCEAIQSGITESRRITRIMFMSTIFSILLNQI